jgi:hypothetical protein
MIVSRNEIESLALKAARGAGMSWGLSEEASVAAGWLAEHALPWADTLAGVLAQAHATSPPRIVGQQIVPSRLGTRLCPIITGALLSDLGPLASTTEICDVLAPLWLAPFLTSWAGPGSCARLSWGDAHLLVAQSAVAGADAFPAAALAAPFADRVAITLEPIGRSAQSRPHREPSGYAAPDNAWRALQELEHRTYVPASAHSRLAGAGAGLLDND